MTKGLFVLFLACAGAANASTWHSGDLTTYTQDNWGGDPSVDAGAMLLQAKYDTVYAGTFGLVTVGSTSGFTMTFTDAASALTYLPAVGPFAPLNGSSLNPISTASRGFGGEVLGLEFNLDFSDAGFLPGASGIPFGNLILENFSTPAFNGLTVRQFLGDVNTLLGGGSSVFTIADLGSTVADVNASFSAGNPSVFAQDHLVAPASAVPEPFSWLLLIAGVLGLGMPWRLRQSVRGAPKTPANSVMKSGGVFRQSHKGTVGSLSEGDFIPRILTNVLLGALLAPWLVNAGPITFNFTGTVTQVPIDDFATGIQPRDAITGSFTFDSTAVDVIAAPTAGSYTSTGPAFGIMAAIGPGVLLFQVSGSMNIGILNSFVDQYTGHTSSATLVLDLFFQDSSATVFSSDGLPLSPPALAGFAQRDFHLDQTDVAGNETQVDGNLTSLTCGAGCSVQATPEPSSVALLFSGAILFGARRLVGVRKSKNSRNM